MSLKSQHTHHLQDPPQPSSSPPTSSPPLVYASSRQSTIITKRFRQLGVICRLNAILMVRFWKAAVLQAIFVPLLVIGIVFGIQKASVSNNGAPEPLSNACMTLVYAPPTPETNQIMNYFQTKNQARTNAALQVESQVWEDLNEVPKDNMGIVPMPSDQFVYDYALAHPDTIQLGVVFTKQTPASGPIQWHYQVYYNISHATNMSTTPDFKYSKAAGYDRRSSTDDPYGVQVPSMIRALDEALLTFLDPQHQQADLDYSLRSFPTASSKNGYSSQDDIMAVLTNLLTLPACITMVMAMLRVTKEKESKCKEAMQMMGLTPLVYWSAQWLTAWIMAIVQASVIVGLGYAFRMSVFINTNWLVLWLMFALLTYGMTMLGFLLTTFCQKTGSALGFGFAMVVAVLISMPILTGGSWTQLYLDMETGYRVNSAGEQLPPRLSYNWVMAFLLPFIHFARLWGQILPYATETIDWNTGVRKSPVGFTLSSLTNYKQIPEILQDVLPQPISALTYYGVDILLLALLTLYFDQVIPNEHGHSRGIFFFFESFSNAVRFIWYGGSSGVARQRSAEAQRIIPYEDQPPANEDSDVIAERERAVHCQNQVAVRTANLTKKYYKNKPGFFRNLYLSLCCCWCCCRTRRRAHKTENKAVDRLNLITEPNELFALLGQNGAGKSTTMQMLYGVTDPSSGSAFLFNRSIRTDMNDIRANMGVCPQHDVLFNDLTCWEHMLLYAGIKDLPSEALLETINEREAIKENIRERPTWIRSRLEAVQLWKDRHTRAGRLSGGMKRRLSTIISTIGDPDVLILDEPTTGMDPVHRRHVWTFLAQFKRGRCILLTTHSMEEADALGDRVAIMVAGHLKAIGNTTRLKNKFGNGYRVEIALGNSASTTGDQVGHDPQHPNNNGNNTLSQKDLEQEITAATRAIVPESTLLDLSGGVIVFGIPMQAIGHMADLTAMLEKTQAQGKVKNWGIAQTSLEEVFLTLIRSSEDRH
ncbi:ATP-binding cassette sub- A member 1 [Modicella reniformis]|uniref:ATP-binding cassette sub- A member 1 n=1 Tax=Modicella reniformis TaxID=1440133 RepID=A0A9P6IL28_9FUNG|nr:ATP-binding cassette sub- A member 1 [Modicella reniformis]